MIYGKTFLKAIDKIAFLFKKNPSRKIANLLDPDWEAQHPLDGFEDGWLNWVNLVER